MIGSHGAVVGNVQKRQIRRDGEQAGSLARAERGADCRESRRTLGGWSVSQLRCGGCGDHVLSVLC